MSLFVTYDGHYPGGRLGILFTLYRHEYISIEKREEHENYIRTKYPEDYKKFIEYEKKILTKTPNIKEIFFEYLDGKRDHPGFEYFSSEGL